MALVENTAYILVYDDKRYSWDIFLKMFRLLFKWQTVFQNLLQNMNYGQYFIKSSG